jgi:hypothetical protein
LTQEEPLVIHGISNRFSVNDPEEDLRNPELQLPTPNLRWESCLGVGNRELGIGNSYGS